MIKWLKICQNLYVFCLLDQNLCGSHTFEKKEVINLGGKKISGKISVVGFNQMNFNQRLREIDLIFKMSSDL